MRSGEFHTSYAADLALFESARARAAILMALAALASLPIYASPYWMDVANRIGIAVIAAMGLNVLTGFTGQISLANAALLAVGAYTTAALSSRGVSFLIVIPAAGIFSGAVGMIFGVPSLRLKGLYLAMASLAAHFIVAFIAVHWDSMTGGVNGTSVTAPRLGRLGFDSDRSLYYLILPAAILHLWFARNLFRSRVGKAFIAIRDHDVSAEVMGVDVFRHKLLAFAVSSFYAGVAGSLLAYQARIVSPENFPLDVAIDHLAMIIVGGLGSILGSILGAAFITLLPEVLRLLTGSLSQTFPSLVQLFASIKVGVFGLSIVLFLIFEPAGLAARWRKIRTWWALYPFSD